MKQDLIGNFEMNQKALPPLPLGTSDFFALRKEGQIYVDKTSWIYELASQRQKFFLSRPRRFGKSLLISTFECLFKNNINSFKGLAIENLWKDKGPYHVVRLDFSRLKSKVSNFSFILENYLEAQFSEIGFNKKNNGILFTNQLELFIRNLPPSSLVLLIDEYDAPLTACLNDPKKFNDVREDLSDFYSILKSNDRALRFLFLTGITKFSKSSLFSELNNLTDISFDPLYGEILGYTEKEIKEYFGDYLKKAGVSLNIPMEELIGNLRDHYDGFCFDEKASAKVYNPWSTLNFLSRPDRGFLNYWLESGGKTRSLLEYFKTHSLKSPLDFSEEKSIHLEDLTLSSDIESLNDLTLLTQAGYFTIKKVLDDTVYLGYPNKEVSQSMAKLYTDMLLRGKTLVQVGADRMSEHLSEGTPESVFHLLNRIFLSMDVQKNPVRTESEVQRLVQVFLSGAGLRPRVETVNAHGRSDLEVSAGNRHWVLEFKVRRAGDDEEALLKKALEQIRTRRYGESNEAGELVRLALVFSVEARRFVRWALCPAGEDSQEH